MNVLLIDDEKTPEYIYKTYGIEINEWAKTYYTALRYLRREKWDLVLLDHDLGQFVNKVEITGYDILLWLENNKEFLPKRIDCISWNLAGRQRIEQKVRELYG